MAHPKSVLLGGTAMKLKDKSQIINIVLRRKGDDIYYFNNDGIYEKIPISVAFEKKMFDTRQREDGSYYTLGPDFYHAIDDPSNYNLMTKCITKINVGDSIAKLEEIMKTTELTHHEKPQGLDRFITKIEKPIFECETGNFDTNTFDFIRVRACILKHFPERLNYIQKNINGISNKVIEKLKNSSSFRKYGIPISYLKISNIVITNDDTIEYTFELKIATHENK